MSPLQPLREFIRQRLTAAAEEIFSEVEKSIVRLEEDVRLLQGCWTPRVELTRVDQQKLHASYRDALTDPKLRKQQRSSRLDQEEPKPPQIKREPELLRIQQGPVQLELRQHQEEPEPGPVSGNQQEPDGLWLKEDLEEPEPSQVQQEPEPPELSQHQEEPEPGGTVVQFQGEPILLDVCWEHQLTTTNLQLVWKEEEVLSDQREPEPPQLKQDTDEPEDIGPPESDCLQSEEQRKNPEGLDVKDEELELLPIKEELQDELQNPEGLKVEEDLNVPQIKDQLLSEGDPEGPVEPVENQEAPEEKLGNLEGLKVEDLELLQIKEQQEESEPSVFEEEEDVEPAEPVEVQEGPSLLTFLIQSGQQIQQLLWSCDAQTSVEQSVCGPPEPDADWVAPSEPPAPHWEPSRSRDRQEHGGFGPEPDAEPLQGPNPAEDQQSFTELRSCYSCLTPGCEAEPEPPHAPLEPREPGWSWEEKHLIVSPSEEPDPLLLHYQNPPEPQHRFVQLHGFYSGPTPGPEPSRQNRYGSGPVHEPQNLSSRQEENATEPASQNQNQAAGPARTKTKKCQVCGEQVASGRLIRHLKSHPGVKPYACRRCGDRFAESAELSEHTGRHLLAEQRAKRRAGVKNRHKNFYCELCGRGFAELAFLKKHSKAHRWEQPFCESCGKHFRSLEALKSHLKTHGQSAPAPSGGRSIKSSARLQREPQSGRIWREMLTTGQPDGPRRAAPLPDTLFCKICKRLFVYKTSYIFHMKAHQKMARVTCKSCGRKFPDREALALHRKRCGKPYSCKKCGKHFVSKTGVSRHQKKGHCRGMAPPQP